MMSGLTRLSYELLKVKSSSSKNFRSYKNFGHKRQPIPLVTTLWHGFLTFTFIGLGIEWNKIASYIFGGTTKTLEIEESSENVD